MKKFICLILVMLMTISLVACNSNKDSGENTGEDTGTPVTPVEVNEALLQEALDAVKSELGSDYLPAAPVDGAFLSERCSLTPDYLKDYVGGIPLISVNVDSIYIINAQEGKGDDLLAELDAYKETQVQDSMQYPMNAPIVSEIVTGKVEGTDVVYFLCLGGEIGDLDTDDAVSAQAKDLNARAEQAIIDTILGK